jgi:hypothetical protein
MGFSMFNPTHWCVCPSIAGNSPGSWRIFMKLCFALLLSLSIVLSGCASAPLCGAGGAAGGAYAGHKLGKGSTGATVGGAAAGGALGAALCD